MYIYVHVYMHVCTLNKSQCHVSPRLLCIVHSPYKGSCVKSLHIYTYIHIYTHIYTYIHIYIYSNARHTNKRKQNTQKNKLP